MASFIARRAATRAFSTSIRRSAADASQQNFRQDAKRNPELFVLGGIMTFAFIGAGFYFGRHPTASTSEQEVPHAGDPWETGSHKGKYQYFPGGDKSAQPKEAPSAINVVIVPDVNLPKELHDKFNKWGKDGY